MQPHEPQELPIRQLDWERLIPVVGRANRAVAVFEGLLYGLPSAEVLLAPMTTQEAVLSSRIEGTIADLEDVFTFEAGNDTTDESRRQDILEIVNYRKALHHAQHLLNAKPFCLNTLLELHSILMDSVRGHNKARGQLRAAQNWIGRPGSTQEEAYFVPPIPETLRAYIGKWESYYHAVEPDPLVQLAVLHAQFELLHPFLDGNGRLGRMLVPLFLYEKKILSRPCFYISDYLEAHRETYYMLLRRLPEPGGWTDWVEYFLTAVATQGEANTTKARAIHKLYEQLKSEFVAHTNSRYAVPLLDFAFQHPVFSSSMLYGRDDMPSKQSVASILDRLKQSGALQIRQDWSGSRPQILALHKLIALCEGRSVFSDHEN